MLDNISLKFVVCSQGPKRQKRGVVHFGDNVDVDAMDFSPSHEPEEHEVPMPQSIEALDTVSTVLI
jgi:hypothetical protein